MQRIMETKTLQEDSTIMCNSSLHNTGSGIIVLASCYEDFLLLALCIPTSPFTNFDEMIIVNLYMYIM